jgi:hypothetical protein
MSNRKIANLDSRRMGGSFRRVVDGQQPLQVTGLKV